MTLNSKQDEKSTADEWKLMKNISAFPQYSSDQVLINALYNMALEEMENAVEKDSTLPFSNANLLAPRVTHRQLSVYIQSSSS